MNLVNKLSDYGAAALFADGHASYNPTEHKFSGQHTLKGVPVDDRLRPDVVRDLTMPKDSQPLYEDEMAPALVHHPEFSKILSRKDEVYRLLPEVHPLTFSADNNELEEAAAAIPGYRVIVKPLEGAGAKGVRVVRKSELSIIKAEGDMLVQEYIDTSAGDPGLGIEGTHNLRVISIDSLLIGAASRIGGRRKEILLADGHGRVFEPEELPEEVHSIVDTIHDKFQELPGSGKNVLGIDLMYGKSKGREARYVVCEINRRPVRISPWDLKRDDVYDPAGMLWLGYEWDKYEAKMLADMAGGVKDSK